MAREYYGDPHGDVEWEMGRSTSPTAEIDMTKGGATPTLKVKLEARPKNPDAKVQKKVVRFHFTIKNIW